MFLRYQSEESLYYASIDRRDGTTAIKKKVPGGPSNGGTYYQLAGRRHAVTLARVGPRPRHRREQRRRQRDDPPLRRGPARRARSTAALGGPPITHAGKVGLRGDNADFSFDAFKVTAL